jgi:hypothetical protein
MFDDKGYIGNKIFLPLTLCVLEDGGYLGMTQFKHVKRKNLNLGLA